MTHASRWQQGLLALCAFALLQLGLVWWVQETQFGGLPGIPVALYGPPANADSGSLRSTATPSVEELRFPPSNPLARTGLRSGDLIDLRALPAPDRYRWQIGYWLAGERIPAVVIRHGAVSRVALTAVWLPEVWYGTLANAGLLWMLLFATVLAWRRPDDPEARALALLLIVYCIGLDFQSQNWISPWPWLDALLNALSGPLTAAGLVMLAVYAMVFARPPGLLRRSLAWASYAGAVVAGALGVVAPMALWFGWPLSGALTGWGFVSLTNVLSYLCPAACLIATIAQTRGAEHARVTWAGVPLLPFYLVYALPATLFTSPLWQQQWLYAINGVIFLAPLGLTYSLLSRRLLDIGFVLNRAAVFAGTSLLLAGLFAGLQWAANAIVAREVHAHDAIVEITIVILVYYAVWALRRNTDRVITRLLFASRDRRLHAIRSLTRAVDDVTDADAIAPFVVDYLGTRAGLDAAVFLQNADGAYEPAAGAGPEAAAIPRDHVAVVILRSAREALAAPEWREHLGTAFPMLVRGRVRGILFCRPPNEGEFAPDETRALESLASTMAGDRDDLLAAALRAENDALRAQLDGPLSPFRLGRP